MFLTVGVFLLILSILVFCHEFGHFLVAKKAGIKVEEFGFGLPPRIFAKKIGETFYSINLLPIGGFVKLAGEDMEDEGRRKGVERERMFWAKPKRVRLAVVIAGVLMNFLLSVVAFSFVYANVGIPTKTSSVRVVGVLPNSPAEKAGFKEEDVLISVDGKDIKDTSEFIKITNEFAGRSMVVEVFRKKDNPCVGDDLLKEKVLGAYPGVEISCKDNNLLLKVVPRKDPPEGEGPLGVVISQVEMRFYPLWKMIPLGIIEGFKEAFSWAKLVLKSLASMLFQLFAFGVLPKDVAGPVGIFQITGIVAKTGFLSVLQFLGILSVNLAVINILPLPALDGGRLLFILFESVFGRRPHVNFERWVHTAGMVFLLFLFLLVTINDILRIFKNSPFFIQLKSFFTP